MDCFHTQKKYIHRKKGKKKTWQLIRLFLDENVDMDLGIFLFKFRIDGKIKIEIKITAVYKIFTVPDTWVKIFIDC